MQSHIRVLSVVHWCSTVSDIASVTVRYSVPPIPHRVHLFHTHVHLFHTVSTNSTPGPVSDIHTRSGPHVASSRPVQSLTCRLGTAAVHSLTSLRAVQSLTRSRTVQSLTARLGDNGVSRGLLAPLRLALQQREQRVEAELGVDGLLQMRRREVDLREAQNTSQGTSFKMGNE